MAATVPSTSAATQIAASTAGLRSALLSRVP
jgi:hypothetical protein